MSFFKKTPQLKKAVIEKAMIEIEKMLLKLDSEGKDLMTMKLKPYQKTHNIACLCKKCSLANKKNNPRLRGLTEYGFKVFVSEDDREEL